MRRQTESKAAIADGLTGVGQCYYKMANYTEAKEYFQKALNYRNASGIETGIETNYKYLGYIEHQTGDLDSALDYLNDGLVKAQQGAQLNSQSNILKEISDIYYEQGKYKKSFNLLKEKRAIEDSLYNKNIARRTAALKLREKIQKQSGEVTRIKRQNRISELELAKSREIRFLLILALIMLLIVLITIIKIYQKKHKIKKLAGLIPICSNCKKIRTDKGYYEHLEKYISEHSEAEFSHGLCPECIEELYPEYAEKNKERNTETNNTKA